MAQALSIKDWCQSNGYSNYCDKLIELEFETIDDLCILSENDLNDVCKELGLKWGKKSKFLQAIKNANNNNNNNINEEKKENKVNINIKKKRQPKKEVSLIFVGATGVGKTTLLKSIEDFINGVSFEKAKETPKVVGDCTKSQTKISEQYTVSNDEWVVNIIDTPGIGDTEGFEQDEKNMDNITDFLSDYGEFNCICVLVKRGETRLTFRFQYIINEIRQNLPKDVASNFITVMTRADVPIPDENTMKAIQKLHLPFDNVIPINNVAYEKLDTSKYKPDSPIAKAARNKAKSEYKNNHENLQLLFETASKMKPYGGNKIKQLKIKRHKLKEQIGLLTMKIESSFDLEKQLKEKKAELIDAKNDKKKFEKFERESVIEKKIPYKKEGKISTACTVCNKVCHIDCGLSYCDTLEYCCCISQGRCKKCGHSVGNHTHLGWDFRIETEKTFAVDESMKSKFEDAQSRHKIIEEQKESINRRMRSEEKEREKFAQEIANTYNELSKIAIIGHNESAEEYMKEYKKAIEEGEFTPDEKKKRLISIDKMIKQTQLLKNVVHDKIKAAHGKIKAVGQSIGGFFGKNK